jgi:hypothetical protein
MINLWIIRNPAVVAKEILKSMSAAFGTGEFLWPEARVRGGYVQVKKTQCVENLLLTVGKAGQEKDGDSSRSFLRKCLLPLCLILRTSNELSDVMEQVFLSTKNHWCR